MVERTKDELADELGFMADEYTMNAADRLCLDEASEALRSMPEGTPHEGRVISEQLQGKGQGKTFVFKTGPCRGWPDAKPATLIIHHGEENDEV